MKIFKFLGATLAFSALLAACGGGGGNTLTAPPTPPGGGGATVAAIAVSSNPATVAADGSTTAKITAVARDASNAAVTGAVLSFSVTTGGLLTNVSATTDASGQATANLAATTGAVAGTPLVVSAKTSTGTVITGTVSVGVVAIQQTLTMSTDAAQIPSDGSKSATVSALLKDANNAVLPGVTVSFTATSGSLNPASAVTDANGVAKTLVNATTTDPTNRTIIVRAKGGAAAETQIAVDVTGTSLSISGPPNLVLGNTGAYTVLLTDSAGKGIANQPVTFVSAKGNALAPASTSTDFTGKATTQLNASIAGADTVTATAVGLQAKQNVAVSSQNFSVTLPVAGTKIPLATSQSVTATWLSSGLPVVGRAVNFSATRGTIVGSPATTDANGVATVQVSSATAGPVIITASGTAADGSGVTAQSSAVFVATVPASITLQASPSSIPTQSQSTITAVVRDAQNNLVQDQTVVFNLTDATNGSLSLNNVVTDGQGRAQTIYASSSTTSALNGVQVGAQVLGTAVTGTTSLTVGGQTVFLSLGTGNTINALNDAQYAVTYAVQARAADGGAVPNIAVNLAVTPTYYYKGSRFWTGTFWATPSLPQCASEDVNNNGILDPGEDYNGNGMLDPGGDSATVLPSSGTTDATGTVLVQVVYTKQIAYWVKVKLTATATVQGTQSSTSASFYLAGSTADFNLQTKAPPGPDSKFGVASVCSNPL